MSPLEFHLKTIHVIANLFWIGSIVAVGVLLAAPIATARERGVLARTLYSRLAVPAFLVSFAAGALRLFLGLEFYFSTTHFMHAKLPLALGVIALHGIVGARARRMANGTKDNAGPAGVLVAVLAVLAVSAAWLAVEKPF